MDNDWLSLCNDDNLYMPPLERYIYLLPDHVVKQRLKESEQGFNHYKPDFATLKKRDDNELAALKLVQEYTDIPVPKLVYQGEEFAAHRLRKPPPRYIDSLTALSSLWDYFIDIDPHPQPTSFNVFTRIQGICVNRKEIWDTITPRQREGLLLQTRDIIHTLATKIPSPLPGWIYSPHEEGILFRPKQIPSVGPFSSTRHLLMENPDLIGLIDPDSEPVFSHLDWDLSNIIIAENGDAVVGVVDWERACWFPEAGKAMHELAFQWDGWEGLFDSESSLE